MRKVPGLPGLSLMTARVLHSSVLRLPATPAVNELRRKIRWRFTGRRSGQMICLSPECLVSTQLPRWRWRSHVESEITSKIRGPHIASTTGPRFGEVLVFWGGSPVPEIGLDAFFGQESETAPFRSFAPITRLPCSRHRLTCRRKKTPRSGLAAPFTHRTKCEIISRFQRLT